MTREELLFDAADKGNTVQVKRLLNSRMLGMIKPVDAHITRDDGWTPLMSAACKGHIDAAALLLEKGVAVDAKTEDQFTALMGAAKYGHKNMAAFLLDKGADIHASKVGKDQGENPLMFAAWQGHADVVELLIQRGADVNGKTPHGYNAMMAAAKPGHLDVMKVLHQKGADINAAKTGDDEGWNPIMYAAWKGHADAVKWLLENGANVDPRSRSGWSPLLFAARECHRDVTKILLDNGADIDAIHNDGWSPLILAAFNGCDKIIDLLLDRGANMEIVANDNLNALETAIEKNFENIALTLVKRGAGLDHPQSDGTPLLTKVVARGMGKLLSAILETGKIDVNETDKHGITALMKASQSNLKAVTLILQHKPDVNLKDKQGNTALDFATRKNQKKIITLLKDVGAKYGTVTEEKPKTKGARFETKDGLPVLSTQLLDLDLRDSSTLGPAGPGGSSFQDAIQALNNGNNSGARQHFNSALQKGLDPLRQGYAYANLGILSFKKRDLPDVIKKFMKVFELKTVLYESAHDAAQYMQVIYSELGRSDEASRLLNLTSRTGSHLGYYLDSAVAEELRKSVKNQRHKLLKTESRE